MNIKSAYIEAMVIFNHIFGHQPGEQQQTSTQQQQRGGQGGQQQNEQQGQGAEASFRQQRRRRSVPHLSGDHKRNEKSE